MAFPYLRISGSKWRERVVPSCVAPGCRTSLFNAVFIAFLCLPLAQQTSYAAATSVNVREACEPILAASVTSETNISQGYYNKSDVKSWLCSFNYQSKDEAERSGVNVDAIIDGVVIGAMYSNDQSERTVARSQLCTTSNSSSEEAYRSIIHRINRDPSAYRRYSDCVSDVLKSSDDLSCHAQVSDTNDSKVELTILYRPSVAHTGKLSGAVLTGAKLDGSNKDIFDYIKGMLRHNPHAPATPFTLSVFLERVGQGSGNFTLNMDDGQHCTADFEAIPATAHIIFTAVGTPLSSKEGRQSFRIDDVKDCDSSSDYKNLIVNASPDEFFVSNQDVLGQIRINSANCGSQITGASLLSAKQAKVDYYVKGCGYQNLIVGRNCEGRGWVDAEGFLKTRAADPNQPASYTFEDEQKYADGKIGVRQFTFMESLSRDFRLSEMRFVLEVKLPKTDEGGANATSIILEGRTGSPPVPASSSCKVFHSGGNSNYVGAVFSAQTVVTLMQGVGDCEGFATRVQNVVSTVGPASPAMSCANAIDGVPRLREGVDPSTATGEDVFGPANDCHR